MTKESPLAVISDANSLNTKLFSLPRLSILSALAAFDSDGALYRELKAGLAMDDGILVFNLNVLQKMGYIRKAVARVEKKRMDSFQITKEGREELHRVASWLKKFADMAGAGEMG